MEKKYTSALLYKVAGEEGLPVDLLDYYENKENAEKLCDVINQHFGPDVACVIDIKEPKKKKSRKKKTT